MSWGVNIVGKPAAVAAELDRVSAELQGESKVEFDAALPGLKSLVLENRVTEAGAAQGYVEPAVFLEASGHGTSGLSRVCSASVKSIYARIVVALLAAFVLATGAVGCAAPPLISGAGGAANSQDTDGKTATMEPQVGLVQPGAFGGVTQSKLAYQRQSTGTQSAPSVILNLQPAAGATVAGTYPELRFIVLSPVIVMGNSQVEPTLSSEQIKAVGDVTKEAGAALQSAIESAAKAPVAPPK